MATAAKLTLRAFPRLHLTLIDLGGATRRAYGGAGIFLDAFATEIEATSSKSLCIAYEVDVDAGAKENVADALARLERIRSSLVGTFIVRSSAPQHVGFGSKTALILSILKAVDIHNGSSFDDKTLQALSGRGGASGIGVNGFFTGGFVVDCGRPMEDVNRFGPSSGASPNNVPPVALRLHVPDSWRFHLVLPRGQKFSGGMEEEFFSANTPVPKKEVLKALALVYHGIVPAVITNDVPLFGKVLDELHDCGFKKRELEGQADGVKQLMTQLRRETGAAVGMSSMGPLLYVIDSGGKRETEIKIIELARQFGAEYLGACSARNRGYEWAL